MMRRKVGKLLGDRRVVGGFLLLIQLVRRKLGKYGISLADTGTDRAERYHCHLAGA